VSSTFAHSSSEKCGLDRVPFRIEQDAAMPLRNLGISQTFLKVLQPEASDS